MDHSKIVGRKKELATLKRLYESDKSEFVAVYGRRRVGKSYLIDEVFKEDIVFSAVGIFRKHKDNEDSLSFSISYKKLQLNHFYQSLLDHGLDMSFPKPESWMEAFTLLKILLKGNKNKRKVVFLDELPWLAGTQSSELVEELGYFWNSWAVKQRNILLVVCGSATGWMLDNVIRDYGGLHNRLTEKFLLKPFTLGECKEYFTQRGFLMSEYEMALCYMAMGGIPYYLDKLRKEWTLTRNIDAFYFRNDSIHQEFEDVYTGLFSSPMKYMYTIRALSKKFYGMTRNELSQAAGIKGGGTFSRMLDNLKECGIIREYPRYGGPRKETLYQLKDYFTLFYLNFVDPKSAKYEWKAFLRTEQYQIWAGHTFEILCSDHLPVIADALRIKSPGKDYCWNGTRPDGKGAQIDLVIPAPAERTDYICEIKFSENKFEMTGQYAGNLADKISAFRVSKDHKPSHSTLLVLITTMGLNHSEYNGIASESISLKDLFA